MAEMKETYRGIVLPGQCDHFGHLNVRYYAHFFDDGAFHLWSLFGFSLKAMQAAGYHTVVAHTGTNYVKELVAGDLVVIRGGFIRLGTKSCRYRQFMLHADTGDLHATQDGVEVFFDPEARTALPIPAPVRATIGQNLITIDGEGTGDGC
jgi:acyl-CoA thioester hydrolase